MSSEIKRNSADNPGKTPADDPGVTRATTSATPATPAPGSQAIHLANPPLSRQELRDLPDYDGEVPPPLEGADPGNEDAGEPAQTTGLGDEAGVDDLRAWLSRNSEDGPNPPPPPDGPNDGADSPPPKNPDGGTDRGAEKTGQPEKIIERQDKVISAQDTVITQQERIIDYQGKSIEQKDARIGELEDKVAGLESERDAARSEAARLKAELAEARKDKPAETTDKPVGSQSAVDTATNTITDRDMGEREKDSASRWYKKIPSAEATDIISKSAVAFGTIAVTTGLFSGPLEKVIEVIAGVGLSVLAFKRVKSKDKGRAQ